MRAIDLLPQSSGRNYWWKNVSLVWRFLLLSTSIEKTYQCSSNSSWISTITHPISLPSTVEKWKNEMHSKCEIVSSVCWHEIIERVGIRMERCHQTDENVSKYSTLKSWSTINHLILGLNQVGKSLNSYWKQTSFYILIYIIYSHSSHLIHTLMRF